MVIHVKLSEVLRDRSEKLPAGDTFDLQLPNDATVNDLLERLNLQQSGKVVVILNATVQQSGDLLHNGDCVTIFPVVEGG